MIIRIGADELILWLRKNNKAVGEDNRTLGKDIKDLIENLGGNNLPNANENCLWANEADDKNIEHNNLPRRAAQYEIDVEQISKIFSEINNW